MVLPTWFIVALLLIASVDARSQNNGSPLHQPLSAHPVEWYNALALDVQYYGYYNWASWDTTEKEYAELEYGNLPRISWYINQFHVGFQSTYSGDSVTFAVKYIDSNERNHKTEIGFHLLSDSAVAVLNLRINDTSTAYHDTSEYIHCRNFTLMDNAWTLLPNDTLYLLLKNGELLTTSDYELQSSGRYRTENYMVFGGGSYAGYLKLYHIETSGVKEERPRKVQVYPNPASHEITCSLPLTKPQNVRLDLYDITGRLVRHTEQGNVRQGESLMIRDLSLLIPGLYTLRYSSEEVQGTQKIMIKR